MIDLFTPPEKDIFTIKCLHIDGQDLMIEVGAIVPNESNEIGAPINHWNVPIKLTYTKPSVHDPDQDQVRSFFLSFIDVTSGDMEKHHAFAKHLLKVDLTDQLSQP